MDMRKKLSIIVLTLAMAAMFCVPAASWAETSLPQRSQEITEVKGAAQPANIEEEAEEAEISESYQMQSLIELNQAGKFHCDNENITISENSAGEGLLIKGTPADINAATFTVEKDFVLEDSSVARFRLDALAQVKTNVTAALFLDDADTPILEHKLNIQKGSKTWTWTGDITMDVADKNIHGTVQTVSLKLTTDSTAKNVSVLLRGFEFMKEDGLPTVYFDIDESIQPISAMNNDSNHETECFGNMTLKIPAGYKSEYGGEKYTDAVSTTYPMEYIRGRGNSTWMADKKPYKVKLEKKADLLNMGANKHWVLLANRYDNSLLRNKITYWMGDQLGMEFTPQCEFVDVVMNGEYLGSYYLCEQIRVGDSRVDINDLEDDGKKAEQAADGIFAVDEPQITGGYLLGMSPYTEDIEAHPEQMIKTDRHFEFEIESPDFSKGQSDAAKEAQYGYISDYVQKTEDAIYGKDFRDAAGTSWEEYLDKESAINYYWFQEVSMNGDAYGSPSSYMYKKRDGKLFFGPLWDFDYVAWGDLEYGDPDVEGFMQTGSFWFNRLLGDDTFLQDLKDRYVQISDVLKAAQGQLDAYADQIRTSDFYEREKWGAYGEGGYYDYYDGYNSGADYEPASFQEEVDLLKNWIKVRDEWISDNLGDLKPNGVTVTFKDGNKVLATVKMPESGYLEDIPDPGTKAGKVFAGWYAVYDDISGPYDFQYGIYEDMVLTAHWVDADKVIPVKNLYFEFDQIAFETSLEENYGESFFIPCVIVPFDATQRMLKWSSSDPSILEVDPQTGVAAPKGFGTVRVTAVSANGKKAVCDVTVRPYSDDPNYTVALENDSMSLYAGEYGKVRFSNDMDPIPTGFISYDVEDSSVLEIGDCGVFKALRDGKTKIIVTNDYTGNSMTLTVTVKLKEKKGAAAARNGLKYVITKKWTKKAKSGTVKVKGFSDGAVKTVKIPASIKINGHTYKVTAVAANAFKGRKSIKSVTFGKNIRTIGAKAFFKCKKLKTVTFTGKTIKKVGMAAFKGIAKKAVFTVPNGGKKAYKKRLKKSAGITGSMKVRAKKISYKKL